MEAKFLESLGGKLGENWATRIVTPALLFWAGLKPYQRSLEHYRIGIRLPYCLYCFEGVECWVIFKDSLRTRVRAWVSGQ